MTFHLIRYGLVITGACVLTNYTSVTYAAHLHDNAALARLEALDQTDRTPSSGAIHWNQVKRRDAARLAKVSRMLAKGQVRTGDDYFNAAVIFQHGPSVADTRTAFALASLAARLEPGNHQASTLMADAWDRLLMRQGQPQWYGTQVVKSKKDGHWHLYPIAPHAVSNAQRKSLGLPTPAQMRAHIAKMNASLDQAAKPPTAPHG
ncbi:hypothetical protein [Oleiagrimonas sp. C23AA]|uniref:hypothetical protein n=1 Tax=Oleiagrimonas sp. C23AA TaxID=2719047 RepID=UPI001420B603|nr:hypothetical protein [Oleiagrimonas sp. C23AA]NII12178.1 hypothetical protein [Oleiagrimonas sp. C23AA]